MYHLVRSICFYIPRRCRGVIAIFCFILATIGALFILHLLAVLQGVGTRELQVTEEDIINTIPKRKGSSKLLFTEGKSEPANNGVVPSLNVLCIPLVTRIVLFIRIPKCASTSFVELMQNQTLVREFALHFNPSGAFNWNWQTIRQVTNFIKNQQIISDRVLYVRHFYHTKFDSLLNYTYITLVREPVARLVSSYLYYHFSSRPHIQAILNPAHKNESLETCINLSHEGCTANLMTKYFCGHDPICDGGSMIALERAKANIAKYFAVIGIVENLRQSYALFKSIIPSYFQHLDISTSTLVRKNRNEHSLKLSPQLRQKLEQVNKADVQLYQYIKQRFHSQVDKCNID